MRTTTDLRHIFPIISGTLTDGSGTVYGLDGHNVPAGSLSFKSGTSPAGTFAVGGAVISSVSFALLDAASYFSSVVWKNARVEFTLTCEQTAVSMGDYYIVSHSESGGVISVTAMDALKVLDEYEMHEIAVTYPTTVGALAGAIAAAHGLTVTGIRNASMSIDEPENDRMTQRACLSYLAQISGQYVQAKGSVLSFGWYDLSNPVSDGATFGHDWGTSDVTVTGIRVSDTENKLNEDRGSDGYRLEISGNPFITSDNISAVADTIWAACSGISFRAGSAEILASPAFEAGDCVTVRTPDESNVKLLLTNITYTTDVSMSITSDADAQAGDLALNKSPYVKRDEAGKAADDAIAEQLADPDSDLSKAISGAGGGSGDKIIEIEGDTYGIYPRYGGRYNVQNITIDGVLYKTLCYSSLPDTITGITILPQKIIVPAYFEKTTSAGVNFNVTLLCGIVGISGTCAVTIPAQWVSEDKIELKILTGTQAGVNPYIIAWEGISGSSDHFVKAVFAPVDKNATYRAYKYITKNTTNDKWKLTTNVS